jgi:hypothetical protein
MLDPPANQMCAHASPEGEGVGRSPTDEGFRPPEVVTGANRAPPLWRWFEDPHPALRATLSRREKGCSARDSLKSRVRAALSISGD